jgi:hypothetical protein
MRADICDSNDDKAIQKFMDVLNKMGAEFKERGWAIGVDAYRVSIGDQELTIFSDSWYLDIEGPEDLVSRILKNLEVG